MSREVFEYFFDPEELEPFYSEIPAVHRQSSARRVGQTRAPSPRVQIDSDKRGQRLDGENPTKAVVVDTVAMPGRAAPISPENDSAKDASDATTAVAHGSSKTGVASATPSFESGRTRVRLLVSVHALGQAAYCVRSAIQSLEQGDESEIDEQLPRLTYLANYELDNIIAALSRNLRTAGLSFLYAIGLIGLMYFARQRQDNLMFNAAGIIFLVNLYWFIDLMSNIVVLTNRRRLAIGAQAQEPDPQIVGIQPIDWWSLLKAGFEPVTYERPFRHPELPLEGCPWRVLERGSIRIPVIRSGGAKLGNRKGELYDKHQIRLVAYALLLEAMDHVEVPFGLVVAADSPKGLAMSITPALRERAIRFLNDFVNNLQNSQQHGLEPRPPHNRNRCAHCKYGVPVEISAREIHSERKRGKSLLVLQNGNGKTYHCQCGDRFRTAPPHAKSIKLGLSAALDYA